MILKAYKFEDIYGFNGFIKALSAGKARYKIFLSVNDAGYDLSITDIKVKRAYQFDNLDLPSNHPVNEYHARLCKMLS